MNAILDNLKRSISGHPEILSLCLRLLAYFEGQVENPLDFYMHAQIASHFPNTKTSDLIDALDILAQPKFSALNKIFFLFLSDDSIYEFPTKSIIEILEDGYFYHPETNNKTHNLNEICVAYEIGDGLRHGGQM